MILEEGQTFTIVADPSVKGNAQEVGTSFVTLHQDVTPGQVILVDDGLLRLRVKSVEGLRVNTVVEIGGKISNNKGMNIPGAALSVPSLTDKDRIDLEFGIGLGVDFIALSFVRSALDILELRTLLTELTDNQPGIIF